MDEHFLPAIFKKIALKAALKKNAGQQHISRNGWESTAPTPVKALKEQVDGWIAGHQSGALKSWEDLKVKLGGICEFPDVHHYVLFTAQFAEEFSERPQVYQELTDLVIYGLQGLTVYSLSEPHANKNNAQAYHGCINTITSLLKKEDGKAKWVDEGAELEQAILQQFYDSFQGVYDRKKQDGLNLQHQYLLDRLGEYGFDQGLDFTLGLSETMVEVFAQICTNMSAEEKGELQKCLNGSCSTYSEEFQEFAQNIIDEAETVRQKASVKLSFGSRSLPEPEAV